MDIRDIAISEAERMRQEGWDIPATAGCVLVERVVAEIQRQSESVGTFWYEVDDWGKTHEWGINVKTGAQISDGDLLFTFPPSIEALEDKVAEAIAEYMQQSGIGGEFLAEAIRSGEWKKFRKGE